MSYMCTTVILSNHSPEKNPGVLNHGIQWIRGLAWPRALLCMTAVAACGMVRLCRKHADGNEMFGRILNVVTGLLLLEMHCIPNNEYRIRKLYTDMYTDAYWYWCCILASWTAASCLWKVAMLLRCCICLGRLWSVLGCTGGSVDSTLRLTCNDNLVREICTPKPDRGSRDGSITNWWPWKKPEQSEQIEQDKLHLVRKSFLFSCPLDLYSCKLVTLRDAEKARMYDFQQNLLLLTSIYRTRSLVRR